MAKRTPYHKEQAVIRLIAVGETYPEISKQMGIPVSTIKKIKKRNEIILLKIKREVVLSHTKAVKRALNASHEVLEGMLDAHLNKEIAIPVSDVIRISAEMHNQLTHEPALATKRNKHNGRTQALVKHVYSHI